MSAVKNRLRRPGSADSDFELCLVASNPTVSRSAPIQEMPTKLTRAPGNLASGIGAASPAGEGLTVGNRLLCRYLNGDSQPRCLDRIEMAVKSSGCWLAV